MDGGPMRWRERDFLRQAQHSLYYAKIAQNLFDQSKLPIACSICRVASA
jgi:hypothetical protein